MTPEERAAWLAERKTCLGSSEAAVALGEAPESWGGPFTLWLQKTADAPGLPSTPLLDRGSIMEHAIADEWCRREGVRVRRSGHVRHPQHPWAGCSPDRILVNRNGGDLYQYGPMFGVQFVF